MKKLRTVAAVILLVAISIIAFAGCSENGQRGPLDIRKVTYLIYIGDVNRVEMYVLTPEYQITQYTIYPESGGKYDYLAGELPPEDQYEIKEYETSEASWTSLVNVLTRVNFMELKEDLATKDTVYDASSYYIKVETSDAVHTSGGYAAGIDKDSNNRRFAEARQYIDYALKEKQ